MEYAFDERQLRSLQTAIARNPEVVRQQVGSFLVRALAVINRGIIRNPWRIGMTGGGAPVATGNLRDTHGREVSPFSVRVFPQAEYAPAVHKDRPWLDHVFNTSQGDVRKLEEELLTNITNDLAK
jgi:hypothetical protein